MEQRQQLYQRMIELSDLAIQRKRELVIQGDNRHRSGRKNDDYLTEEERQEFFMIARQLGGIRIEKDYVYCQEKFWKRSDQIS
ncbi:hypothetical protein C7H19_15955 [Aphanothece hegewaldii CCALA 016]|uniref:Uncharacterized protein n=1 Tax=Aphanothece hegewaldii CCALA 016 TaxID=2107694 RepID=A0A2T1LVI0_9CHRO|nr:hypothetical protein [Aphanothece hegewaldii]PSF35726.1 hypothetical protein C7H19_15955 [Aphanothece hegewaldii CCALA 016]